MPEFDKLTTDLIKKGRGNKLTVAKIPQPEKTWFVQQVNGRIFACGEMEAWNLTANADNQWTLRRNKFLGVSDGKVYAAGMIEASKITIEDLVKDKKKLKKMKQSEATEMVNEAVRDRIKKAFDDELAVAIANAKKNGIEYPRNMNVLDLQGRTQTNRKVLDSDFIE